MITLDFENFEDIEFLKKAAKDNNLTIVENEVQNFDASQVLTIMGNTAQIIGLLLTVYQTYSSERIRVNYHSDNYDQDNLSIKNATDLAKKDK